MSNLDASTVRKLVGGSSTPPPGRRNVGTPPPHPNLSAAGSKRAPSPLTRSSTPNQIEKKSLIPKFSPQLGRKTPDQSGRKTPDVGDRSKTPDSLTSSMTRSGTSLTGSKVKFKWKTWSAQNPISISVCYNNSWIFCVRNT